MRKTDHAPAATVSQPYVMKHTPCVALTIKACTDAR